MNALSSIRSEAPENSRLTGLIGLLRATRSPTAKDNWGIYVCAVCYGIIAFHQGLSVLGIYCGVLVLVFMIRGAINRRTRDQIDLLVEIVRELEIRKEN